jgi:hypothetical protein
MPRPMTAFDPMIMNAMTTKWRSEAENRDGTGYTYYVSQCPQEGDGPYGVAYLYEICYSPTTQKLWFWDVSYDNGRTIHMTCDSWEDAEKVKKMLTIGESHWMKEPAARPRP